MFTALFLFISVFSILAADSASSSVWASESSRLTATSYVTSYKGTATATAVRVLCGTTVTQTMNVTVTISLPTRIVTVYVVQATGATMVKSTVSNTTSTFMLSTCAALHQRVVATTTVNGPLYMYSQSQRFDARGMMVGSLVATCYIVIVALCAVAFFHRSGFVKSLQ